MTFTSSCFHILARIQLRCELNLGFTKGRKALIYNTRTDYLVSTASINCPALLSATGACERNHPDAPLHPARVPCEPGLEKNKNYKIQKEKSANIFSASRF